MWAVNKVKTLSILSVLQVEKSFRGAHKKTLLLIEKKQFNWWNGCYGVRNLYAGMACKNAYA
jgi:hypothetical protein